MAVQAPVPKPWKPTLAASLAAAAISLGVHAFAQDNGSVPPPPEVQPALAVGLASPQKAPPAAAVTLDPPPANPAPVPHAQAVTIHVVPQQAPPPPAQPVTFRISAEASPSAASTPAVAAPVAPAPVAAAPVVAAVYRQAGPIRRVIGGLGTKLERVGHDRILVPRAQPVAVPAAQWVLTQTPTAAAVAVPSPQTITVQPAPKCRLFCH